MRDNLEVAARKSRDPSRVRARLDEPPPAECAHVWAWFTELAGARGSNGFGPNPISWLDVAAWSELTGTVIRPDEARALLAVDRAWLVASQRKP